jgi:hypothetical protein
MMKKIIILLVLAVLFGCDDFTSEQRYKDEYFIITGLLYEGEPIKDIFVGKTISPGDSYFDLIIPDADVVIKQYNGDELLQTIPLTFEFGFYQDNGFNEISTDYIYRIEAQIGDVLVSAETEVPASIDILPDEAFTFDENTPDFPELIHATADSEHPIIIQTANESAVSMMFEFYCLEEFADAPQYIYSFGNHNTPDTPEEYESPADGSPRELEFYGNYLPVLEDDGNYYITEQSYSGPFVFYGDYQITIYSLSGNYYNYLYKPDGYTHGGINNGFGYFGAVSGRPIYTEVVE